MTLTIGSLFSGIGGLELGLERAGLGPVVWQCETDPFCCEVLRSHWPDAGRFNDVRDIIYLSPYHQTDILCGGFPCQDISDAGKRAGISGKQSSLWGEFARIVGLVRPRYVVVENVSALLGRGMGTVLGDLAALGYDAEWDCIPAQAVGAPHRRDRIFVVAWRVSDAGRSGVREKPGGRIRGGDGPHSPFARHLGEAVADADSRPGGFSAGVAIAAVSRKKTRIGQEESGRLGRGAWPPGPNDLQAWGEVQADSQPSVCRVAHGVPSRVDRLRSLGNAVVPQVAEVIGRRIVELEQRS